MSQTGTSLSRRRFLVLRVGDEITLDFHAFFRGTVAFRAETQCALLCPVSGESLPVTAAELPLLLQVPSDRWVTAAELDVSEDLWAKLLDMAERGLFLASPAPDKWHDLANREQAIASIHWNEVAAVFHAHSVWRGVKGKLAQDHSDEAHRERLEMRRKISGDPPSHFPRRSDAQERLEMRVPVLEGPFFDALLARRTTRTFRTDVRLPVAKLEIVLYAVFGAHGIKQFAPGIAAIRRTSPSGGALHPIEAYLLALNVDGLATGLYHYETGAHALALLESFDNATARDLTCEFTAGQTYFADAHALVIHVARFDRNYWKYAQHRKAYKVVLMDSAHLSQTFYLTAAHLGLGAFYTAAINDGDIGTRLGLDHVREAAVAINGIGIAQSGRDDMHFITYPHRPTGLA